MSTLEEWTATVCRELGIEGAVDTAEVTRLVLDLARDVAHGVARPAAPLTTYLVGLAAARTDDPTAALPDLAARISASAADWNAERR